jgi:hypothetical protein
MNKRECLQYIIKKEGGCFGIKCEECPLGWNDSGGCKKDCEADYKSAKQRLSEMDAQEKHTTSHTTEHTTQPAIYWEQRRWEATVAIAHGLIEACFMESCEPHQSVSLAVKYADALISEMQKERGEG